MIEEVITETEVSVPGPAEDVDELMDIEIAEGASSSGAEAMNASASDDEIQDGVPALDLAKEGLRNQDALRDALEVIDGHLVDLADLFKAKIAHSDYELEVARKYSADLQEYKDGLFRKVTEPILRAIMKTLMGMDKTRAMAETKGESTVPLDAFIFHCDDLIDLLDDYGIEEFSPEVGDEFISGLHKIMGEGIETTDEEQDRTIAEVKSKGYRSGDGVLMPAKVKVFAFKASKESSADSEEQPSSEQ